MHLVMHAIEWLDISFVFSGGVVALVSCTCDQLITWPTDQHDQLIITSLEHLIITTLEHLLEGGSRQNSLGLIEGFLLVLHSFLSDVEVFE